MSRNGSKAGSYYSPWPIDFRILEKLPEVGTIGGVHWKGRRTKDLPSDIGLEGVTSELVASRLRSMHAGGIVKNFPAGEQTIWARTQKGTELLTKEEEYVPS